MFAEFGAETADEIERALATDLCAREERRQSHPVGGYTSARFVDRIRVHNDRHRLLPEFTD